MPAGATILVAAHGGRGNRFAWQVLVAGIAFVALSSPHAQTTLHDDLNRAIRFDRPPARIVSLLPSITETVCALDQCARLVATDRFSNWPASVAALPRAGGLDDTQVELIVRVRPDVVLLSRSARVTARLDQLGVKTFAVEAQTFPDVARVITLIGAVLDVPDRARALNRHIADAVDDATANAQRARGDRPPRVYFEVAPTPYAAGEGSFVGELLARLGTRNIVPAVLGPFPAINPEFVVRANPQIIFVAPAEAARLAGRPGWSATDAVRHGRVCALGAGERDTVVRPGPRLVEGLAALERCLARYWP